MSPVPILAVGRSGLLYDAIAAVAGSGRYRVAAIITDSAYAEYDVGVDHFASLAARLGAEFWPTKTLSPELITELVARHGIEIGISANWRYVIGKPVLDSIPHGILNLHLGRLPDYKGNATANWIILAGEPEIYADVHVMAEQLDAGDVLVRGMLPVTETTYVGDVLDWARREAPRLFLSALDAALGRPGACVVPGSVHGLRCYPRRPEDGAIGWARTATQVCRLVRASSRPYPGAFTRHRGQQLTVWRASVATAPEPFLAVPGQVLAIDRFTGTVDVACGAGVLRLEETDLDGRAIRPADAIRSLRARLETTPTDTTPSPAIERGIHP